MLCCGRAQRGALVFPERNIRGEIGVGGVYEDKLDSTEDRMVVKAFLEAEKSSRTQSHNSKSNIIWDAG